MLDRLAILTRDGALADLDLHFARLIARVSPDDGPVVLAAALTSLRTRQGHVCLDLARAAAATMTEDADAGIETPHLETWLQALRQHPAVGRPGDLAPLVLDEGGRLYLHRYWAYEREVAEDLARRVRSRSTDVDLARLRQDLDRLFPPTAEGPDWQRIAAANAVLGRFAVISGGPGTGKTTTVVRLLALLLNHAGNRRLRIGLAAPTGKAAARMRDVIRAVKQQLPIDQAIRDAIPEEASTIHRLLRWRPGTAGFQHDRSHPLALDALVLDEASMVDLALMAKLVRALPAAARLILVGDRDQLASVEAGAVLGDICGEAPGFSLAGRRRLAEATGNDPGGDGDGPPIRDALVVLQRSYRFGQRSGIGHVARLVKEGDGRQAVEALENGGFSDILWRPVSTPRDLAQALARMAAEGLSETAAAGSPDEALTALERFRILCAHRGGPFGVVAVNGLIEEHLAARRLVAPRGVWYPGRPVLVTENDYHLRLFNGDLGIIWPDPDAGGQLRAHFRKDEGGLRRFAPARLPAHETAYAATVHKSQGSEADRILFILPNEPSPVLTRELIYTAVTRARAHVEIWGTREVFEAAVARRLVRSSGLRDALWAGR